MNVVVLAVHRSRLTRFLMPKVKYAMARDVRVDELTTMIDKLGSWASTTQVLLETLKVIHSRFLDCMTSYRLESHLDMKLSSLRPTCCRRDNVGVVSFVIPDYDVISSGKNVVCALDYVPVEDCCNIIR